MDFDLKTRQGPYLGMANMAAYLRFKFAVTVPAAKPIISAAQSSRYHNRSPHVKYLLSLKDNDIFHTNYYALVYLVVSIRIEYLKLKETIRIASIKLDEFGFEIKPLKKMSIAEIRKEHEYATNFDSEDDILYIPNLMTADEILPCLLPAPEPAKPSGPPKKEPFVCDPYEPERYNNSHFPWGHPVPSHRVRNMMFLDPVDIGEAGQVELYQAFRDFQRAYMELERGADTWGPEFSIREDFLPRQ
ncbi:hypothetical protein DSL72_007595 [Monilinia vaccinii-corymbosi]|uniref:Uncharacterized protein n=1 Tax=Monilinia vaccinii-corymbosi TaxID=61207 RepID=A0A8A3PI37_9HELO|nr:hypothetical protein DSL72_007595 [Monilinia vaccinii-corymbosi]